MRFSECHRHYIYRANRYKQNTVEKYGYEWVDGVAYKPVWPEPASAPVPEDDVIGITPPGDDDMDGIVGGDPNAWR